MDTYLPPALYSVDLAECGNLGKLQPEEVAATFGAALQHAGATIVHALSPTLPRAGLTCVFILSESHAVLHTWPETGTINIDIFSCSTRLKGLQAIREFGEILGATQLSVREIAR